ncbi:MAG: T9SS type A sorting domain-containing protein [Bacteroidia bacterium]
MKKTTIILIVLFATAIKASAQIPNSSFENWTSFGTYENPNSWDTYNTSCSGTFYTCTKSTDHYPPLVGNYSVRLENNISLLPGFCAEGLLFPSSTSWVLPNTFPITGHPNSLTGWYKFFPLNGDTMTIKVNLFDSITGYVTSGIFTTTIAAPNWTSFNIPIPTYSYADNIAIWIAPWYLANYSPQPPPHGNSVLYVDNLNFDTLITAGFWEINKKENISIIPNPFSSMTTLNVNENLKDATLIIYNLFGQHVKQIKNITGKTITLCRDNLPVGVYFLCLTQDNKTIITDKLIISD